MATEALDAAATNETLKKVDPLGEIKEKPEPVGDLCKAGDEANGKSCCQEKEEPLTTKAKTNGGACEPALKQNGVIEVEDDEGQDEEPEGENEYSSDEEEEDGEGGEEENQGEGEGYDEEEEEEEEYAEDGEGDEDEDDNDESELPPPKRRK